MPRHLTVKSTRVHNGIWLLTFEEIPDRTGAEGLRGARLVLDEAAAANGPEHDQDEEAWSEDDLLGLEVRDPAGEVLGEVTGLEVGTVQDRLVLELTDGVTAYVPFVEAIVPTIAEDHIVVDAPPDSSTCTARRGWSDVAMRIDVITIFPEYLQPLDLSLIGRARQDSVLTVATHDLREFTHDRHRTVDDTPYGGGAGMVMKPAPWAEALDHVSAQAEPGARPHLIVPGPGGTPFTQAMARELAPSRGSPSPAADTEGIDERVYDHAREDLQARGLRGQPGRLRPQWRRGRGPRHGGGDARLLPGCHRQCRVLGRGVARGGAARVPDLHQARVWGVARCRTCSSPATMRRSRTGGATSVSPAPRPAARTCFIPSVAVPGEPTSTLPSWCPLMSLSCSPLALASAAHEALATDALDVPELTQSVDDFRDSLKTTRTWVARKAGRLVGSVRTEVRGDELRISQVLLAPDLRSGGLESHLLSLAEHSAPSGNGPSSSRPMPEVRTASAGTGGRLPARAR